MHLTRLPAWPFTRILRARQDAKKNERRNQLGVMEQNEPFPNPASKLPNLNFSVYAMVDCAPFFVGSVDAPRRVRGRLCFHFSCTEEARSGVCFTERAFSKTRILVPFFWTKTCAFFVKVTKKMGKPANDLRKVRVPPPPTCASQTLAQAPQVPPRCQSRQADAIDALAMRPPRKVRFFSFLNCRERKRKRRRRRGRRRRNRTGSQTMRANQVPPDLSRRVRH